MTETTSVTIHQPEEPVIPFPSEEKTTIPCKIPTRTRVKDYGKKGESYDHLLNRLLDELDTLRKK